MFIIIFTSKHEFFLKKVLILIDFFDYILLLNIMQNNYIFMLFMYTHKS